MDEPSRLHSGYARIAVLLPPKRPTPGELAAAAGVPIDAVGAIHVGDDGNATIDVRADVAPQARRAIEMTIGPCRIAQWKWRWMKLLIGRNHGLTMAQVRKLMIQVEAVPIGKIELANTHVMIGVREHQVEGAIAKLVTMRINGQNIRAEAIPAGMGPGNPEFIPPGAPNAQYERRPPRRRPE